MKYILRVLIICLLLISACSKGTIDARPIDAKVIDVEVNIKESLCDNIECTENSYCVSGKCVCNEGFKMCNAECISEAYCCNSNDCGVGEICENKKCIKHICPFNQVYEPNKEACACDRDSNWCAMQNKCIPRSSCCVHSDCGNDRACSPTYFMASVCVDDGKEKCRSTIQGQNAYFIVNGVSYDIVVKSISKDFVSLKINDKDLDGHPVKVPYKLTDNANLYIDSTKIAGGVCREE
ncbi:hypothetical protein JW851_02790 [Candidatus Woesearchaeota archaeon]|nr:hypothetical protein [Candidatus Woesearchaeota archaeon]